MKNSPAPARIAVVDDDGSIRSALSSLLRSMGYEVALFDSAEAFLNTSEASDCIVTDLQMPGLSGLELLELLTADGDQRPVIIITAFPELQLRERARRLGASSFLSKPFEADVILHALEEALAAHDEPAMHPVTDRA